MNAASPADLTITPRDRRFGRDEATPRHWHGGDPYATAFYNALSVTFPKGEAFFVESVRAFREGADPQLAKEIKAFTTQEAIHSREHAAFNNRVKDSGYDVVPLDAYVDERMAIAKARPMVVQLAATMALEHFTAILAHELLANPKHLAGADKASADLWRWHAAEEIEHKGVAYDTWLHATKDWSRWKRWKVKTLVMLDVTKNFTAGRAQACMELLRQDGITGRKAKWKMFEYAFVSPGMARRVFGMWLTYFLPRFHPWQHDDRKLIAAYEASVPDEGETFAKKVRHAA